MGNEVSVNQFPQDALQLLRRELVLPHENSVTQSSLHVSRNLLCINRPFLQNHPIQTPTLDTHQPSHFGRPNVRGTNLLVDSPI
jgi:hypothetical protein